MYTFVYVHVCTHIHIHIQTQLTLEQCGGTGHRTLYSVKSTYNLSWSSTYADAQSWIEITIQLNPILQSSHAV